LTIEELEIVQEDRIKKIVDLWLSGVMKSTVGGDNEETVVEEWDVGNEKEEIIDNVIQEMEDFGELE
jgi:hypothetical protein